MAKSHNKHVMQQDMIFHPPQLPNAPYSRCSELAPAKSIHKKKAKDRRNSCLCSDGLEHSSEEHTSELQSLMRNSEHVFCLTNKPNSSTLYKHIQQKILH